MDRRHFLRLAATVPAAAAAVGIVGALPPPKPATLPPIKIDGWHEATFDFSEDELDAMFRRAVRALAEDTDRRIVAMYRATPFTA